MYLHQHGRFYSPFPPSRLVSILQVPRSVRGPSRSLTMLWTIFGILLTLWLLGIVSAYTFGGFIHILLWAAVAVVLMRVIENRT
jgi:hypothetical protein